MSTVKYKLFMNFKEQARYDLRESKKTVAICEIMMYN